MMNEVRLHDHTPSHYCFKIIMINYFLVAGVAYQGKDIVFRFIIEYSSLIRDFGP
jgi:hypothetical protein